MRVSPSLCPKPSEVPANAFSLICFPMFLSQTTSYHFTFSCQLFIMHPVYKDLKADQFEMFWYIISINNHIFCIRHLCNCRSTLIIIMWLWVWGDTQTKTNTEDSCDGGTVNAKKHDLQKQTVKAHLTGLYVYRRLPQRAVCDVIVIVRLHMQVTSGLWPVHIWTLIFLTHTYTQEKKRARCLNAAKVLFLCYCLGPV